MSRFCLLLLAYAVVFLGGCASEPPKPTDPERISTMPWNRPQPGEGAGMMGGMLNTR